ncbi:MAG: ABC transporter ATP-binding protein [Bradyrhizobiaceae bacterium]|nr:ABC transporter ATP-binding protein [Bradyrhizobiaceae bacterium]
MNLLETHDLTKAFGALVVTNAVNLRVAMRERHAVIGPNGAGKTSLLNQLGGQLRPSSGKIVFKGQDITGLAPERICKMGVSRTFQRNNLFPNLSVFENVRLAVQSYRGLSWRFIRSAGASPEMREAVERILDQVNLLARARQTTRDLSYGEQRQLEMGIALACNPELLLLDEPTSGMSPAETERMTELIRSFPASLTIIIVEHDMQVVFALADRITVLTYGRVLASGTPAEITANDEVREAYLGQEGGHERSHA